MASGKVQQIAFPNTYDSTVALEARRVHRLGAAMRNVLASWLAALRFQRLRSYKGCLRMMMTLMVQVVESMQGRTWGWEGNRFIHVTAGMRSNTPKMP